MGAAKRLKPLKNAKIVERWCHSQRGKRATRTTNASLSEFGSSRISLVGGGRGGASETTEHPPQKMASHREGLDPP